MSWTAGFGTIAPGTTQRWWFSFSGSDKGPQYCEANPLNPGGSLKVNDETKVKNNDGTITYWVTVSNIGSVATNFNLQGGGF